MPGHEQYPAQVVYIIVNCNHQIFKTMDKYVCDVCGWIYDPAIGDPDNDIAPGIAFEDLPADFVCPLCGVGKDQFSKVE